MVLVLFLRTKTFLPRMPSSYLWLFQHLVKSEIRNPEGMNDVNGDGLRILWNLSRYLFFMQSKYTSHIVVLSMYYKPSSMLGIGARYDMEQP